MAPKIKTPDDVKKFPLFAWTIAAVVALALVGGALNDWFGVFDRFKPVGTSTTAADQKADYGYVEPDVELFILQLIEHGETIGLRLKNQDDLRPSKGSAHGFVVLYNDIVKHHYTPKYMFDYLLKKINEFGTPLDYFWIDVRYEDYEVIVRNNHRFIQEPLNNSDLYEGVKICITMDYIYS